jgi:Fe2+ or Zn2+ uptake regulation protein
MSSKLINIKGELEKCGIKPTFQRLCVLELMEQSSEHLTADAIYESLLKKMPTMSRTTIYNTLNLFLEKGLIAPIMITGTEVRYESQPINTIIFSAYSATEFMMLTFNVRYLKVRKLMDIKSRKFMAISKEYVETV